MRASVLLVTGNVVWSDTMSWHQTIGRQYGTPYLTWESLSIGERGCLYIE